MNKELFNRVTGLLKKRGFVQPLKQDLETYSYGPAGTLLRRNMGQTWFDWMITSQENTFPVENTDSSESSLGYFLDISRQLDWTLPFSIVHSHRCTSPPVQGDKDKFLFNSCKKTSFVMQNFCQASDVTQTLDSAIKSRLQWWRRFSGNPAKFIATDIMVDNGHSTSAIQYEFPWGIDDVEKVSNMGDAPLQPWADSVLAEHQFVVGKKKSLPHVIECNAVLEQGFLAFLLDAYTGNQESPNNGMSDTMCLKLHPRLTPYKMAVCYQGASDKSTVLRKLASRVCKDLGKAGLVILSQVSSSPDTVFIQNDELGIPYTAVLQDSVLESGVVQVRNRDTTIKEQIHITQLVEFVQRNIAGSS